MIFKIEYSKSSEKFLRRLEKVLLSRIFNHLDKLKENPIPSDAKFIKRENKVKVFRIRIGKYRILYKLMDSSKIILISKIDKRGRVYD